MHRVFGILVISLALATPVKSNQLDAIEVANLFETLDRCNQTAKETMLSADQAVLCSITYRLLSDHFGDYAKYSEARDSRLQNSQISTF